jgi:uncharacterized caspase-like protein
MRRLLKAVALVVAVLAAGPALAQGKRVALVIGNSAYKHTPRLDNPKNDAADMAAALTKLGFAVIEGRDLDKGAMERTVRDFAQALSGAQVGLFFYAGHGLQVAGQNYLVPIDAELNTAAAIDFELVRLDLVHRTMERATTTNILVMDACRDNPLARNLARALGTRSSQIGRGFAPVESGEGTLIAFSTQPGNVALDGTGRNSPYAAALLKHIATPGDDLPTILINVRNDVMQATARRQVPWEHSALTAKLYFIPPRTSAQQVELEFWGSVKDSTSPAVLGTYLEDYPNGEFAPVARALIAHYEQQLKAELAAREEEKRRQDEERKAAEVKRLQDERRAREAAIAEERKRAQENKSLADIKRLEEQAKAEWAARTEELKQLMQEAERARDAAKAAEGQRLAAVKSAEEAAKAAQQAIATKRESEKPADPTKLAALPKLDVPGAAGPFDGTWRLELTMNDRCTQKKGVTGYWKIVRGVVLAARGGRGTVSKSGDLRVRWITPTGTRMQTMSAKLAGNQGTGSFQVEGGACAGSVRWARVN